jgi:hypothetical protein
MVSISDADLKWHDSKQRVDYEDNYTSEDINFNIGDVLAHTAFGSGVVVGIKGNFLEIACKAPYGVKTLL